MMEMDLRDPRYIGKPRAFATIVVRRMPLGRYNGKLCERGDLVPLTNAALACAPTAHRCCVATLIAHAVNFGWITRALDISHSFLKAGHLNETDRIAIIPHPTVVLHWKGNSR